MCVGPSGERYVKLDFVCCFTIEKAVQSISRITCARRGVRLTAIATANPRTNQSHSLDTTSSCSMLPRELGGVVDACFKVSWQLHSTVTLI